MVAKDAPPAPPSDAGESNRITITVEKAHPAGSGLAKRCVLGGDPLVSDCVGGSAGVAAGKSGELYVVAGTQVHRYRRAAGEGCRFDPDGAPIDLPKQPTRAQSLDGPVYMRSGGPEWHLASAGDAIYAYDFLAGLYRIDARPAPVCTTVFGYNTLAVAGKRLLVARNGIEQLAPGPHCTAHAAGIDVKARGDVYAIADHLYDVPSAGGSEVVRYDHGKRETIAQGARICSIVGMAACGAGVCLADNNCMQLVQLAADGSVQRTIESSKLFDQRPWSLGALLTERDGSVLVLARHRDKPGDKEVCEAAVYELPAALFQD